MDYQQVSETVTYGMVMVTKMGYGCGYNDGFYYGHPPESGFGYDYYLGNSSESDFGFGAGTVSLRKRGNA